MEKVQSLSETYNYWKPQKEEKDNLVMGSCGGGCGCGGCSCGGG